MKRISLISMILTTVLLFLPATPILKFESGYIWHYDTNIYSNPLVKYTTPAWLEWRVSNPYIKRFNQGIVLELNYFPAIDSRVGFSTSVSNTWAYKEFQTIPIGDFSNHWTYEEKEVSPSQTPQLFIGLGPIFQYKIGIIDLGISLKASLGTFFFQKGELIFGVQAKPYLNFNMTPNLYLSIGGYYNAHLMKFYTNHNTFYFDENFTMMSGGVYMTFGYCFK